MPGGAHHQADSASWRSSEDGFSLMELIVVMILVAIALGGALFTVNSIKRSSADADYVAAASTIWRGIGSYRLDNKGAPPAAAELVNGGASFTNLAGARYVKTWPQDPRGDGPLAVGRGTGATAPTTGTPSSVRYATSGSTAWMAAYGHDGRLVFLRSIVSGTTPEAPVG